MFEDNQPQPEQPAEQAQSQAEQTTQQEPQAQNKPVQPQKPAPKPLQVPQDEKMWAAIGYIAFLGVVTLAMKPKSKFCRHHASQGLVLFVLWFIGLILLAIGSIFSAVGGILMLGITILAVIGIIKAISSYEFNVPVLTGIAKNVPVDAIVGSMTGKKPTPTQQGQPQQPEAKQAPQPPAAPTQEAPQQQAPAQPAQQTEQPAEQTPEQPAEEEQKPENPPQQPPQQ